LITVQYVSELLQDDIEDIAVIDVIDSICWMDDYL